MIWLFERRRGLVVSEEAYDALKKQRVNDEPSFLIKLLWQISLKNSKSNSSQRTQDCATIEVLMQAFIAAISYLKDTSECIFPANSTFEALSNHYFDAVNAEEVYLVKSLCHAWIAFFENDKDHHMPKRKINAFARKIVETIKHVEKLGACFPEALHLVNILISRCWVGNSLLKHLGSLNFIQNPAMIQSPYAIYALGLIPDDYFEVGWTGSSVLLEVENESAGRAPINCPFRLQSLSKWLENLLSAEIRIDPDSLISYITAIRSLMLLTDDNGIERRVFPSRDDEENANRDPFNDLDSLLGKFTWMANEPKIRETALPSLRMLESYSESLVGICSHLCTPILNNFEVGALVSGDEMSAAILFCSVYANVLCYGQGVSVIEASLKFWNLIRILLSSYSQTAAAGSPQYALGHVEAIAKIILLVTQNKHLPPSDDIRTVLLQIFKCVRDQAMQSDKHSTGAIEGPTQARPSSALRDDFMDAESTAKDIDCLEDSPSEQFMYIGFSSEQTLLLQLICRCLLHTDDNEGEVVEDIFEILSCADCKMKYVFPSDKYLDLAGYLSKYMFHDGILSLATMNAWDKECGALGYAKLLSVIWHLSNSKCTSKVATEGTPLPQNALFKIIFPEDSYLNQLLEESWKLRYLRIECSLSQPFGNAIKEPLVETLLAGILDSDIRVRLLVASSLPRLFDLFPKSHAKIYDTIREKIYGNQDVNACVSFPIAITFLCCKSASLTHSCLRDLVILCCSELSGLQSVFKETRFSLLHRLFVYVSSTKGYRSTIDFIDDYFRLLLHSWIQLPNSSIKGIPQFVFSFDDKSVFAKYAATFLLPIIAQLEQFDRFKLLLELSELSGYGSTDSSLASLLTANMCSLKAAEFFFSTRGIMHSSGSSASKNLTLTAKNIQSLIARCMDKDLSTRQLLNNIPLVVEVSYMKWI